MCEPVVLLRLLALSVWAAAHSNGRVHENELSIESDHCLLSVDTALQALLALVLGCVSVRVACSRSSLTARSSAKRAEPHTATCSYLQLLRRWVMQQHAKLAYTCPYPFVERLFTHEPPRPRCCLIRVVCHASLPPFPLPQQQHHSSTCMPEERYYEGCRGRGSRQSRRRGKSVRVLESCLHNLQAGLSRWPIPRTD